MRRCRHWLAVGYVLLLVVGGLLAKSPAAAQAPGLRTEDGRVLPLPGASGQVLTQAGLRPLPQRLPGRPMLQVQRSPGVAPADFAAALGKAGYLDLESTSAFGWWRVAAPEGVSADQAVAQLLALPVVAYADEDRVIRLPTPAPAKNASLPASDLRPQAWPNDPYLAFQWHMPLVGADGAWSATMGSPNVMVAVIDSGFDYHHPDRPRSLLMGYDFANGDTDAYDDLDHGTHVGGIVAAATGNGLGVTGMCPDCTVLSVKVLNEFGGAYASDVASAIDYSVFCAQQFGKRLIINLSLGAPFPDEYDLAEAQAIARAHEAGALVVAAAGNGNAQQPAPWYASFPANYDGVMSVAATDADDQPSAFSYWADTDGLGLAAPGRDIWSLLPLWSGTDYGPKSGTSMASPLVAGAAGLVWSAHPSWTAHQVAQRLIACVEVPSGWTYAFGAGRLDVDAALQPIPSTPTPTAVPSATATPSPTQTPSPTATATASATATATATGTPTVTTSATPSPTATVTATASRTATAAPVLGRSSLPMIWSSPPLPGPSPTPGGVYPWPSPRPTILPTPDYDPWIEGLDGVAQIWSFDGHTYLGLISSVRSLPDSITNRTGAYGSLSSATSISNADGFYGNATGESGARNPTAPYPPVIWRPVGAGWELVGFVTLNPARAPRLDPNYLVNYLLAKGGAIEPPPSPPS